MISTGLAYGGGEVDVRSEEWGVRSEEWGVRRSEEWGVRSEEWGVRSEEWGVRRGVRRSEKKWGEVRRSEMQEISWPACRDVMRAMKVRKREDKRREVTRVNDYNLREMDATLRFAAKRWAIWANATTERRSSVILSLCVVKSMLLTACIANSEHDITSQHTSEENKAASLR
jgi:hypothetical protein